MTTRTTAQALVLTAVLLCGQVFAEGPPSSDVPVNDAAPVVAAEIEKDAEFVAAEERIKKEERFSKLRRDRRELVEKIPKLKVEVDGLQAELTALKSKDRESSEKLTSLPVTSDRAAVWNSRVLAIEQRLQELKKRGQAEGQSRKDYEEALTETSSELNFVRVRARDAETEATSNEAERRQLKAQLDEGRRLMPLKEQEVKAKARELASLIERQELVEDAINTLLIPETARNEFKLLITGAFSVLVGLVILGFFAIAFRDEVVRRSIFSSQSGIQFITLFSLVIAIILFGITNILAGKELAALLGGLSGYILGRVTDRPTPAT